jgi:hypothetical protein
LLFQDVKKDIEKRNRDAAAVITAIPGVFNELLFYTIPLTIFLLPLPHLLLPPSYFDFKSFII